MAGLNKKKMELMKRFLEKKKGEYTERLEHLSAVQKEEKTGEANDRSCTTGHLADCINDCSIVGNPEQMIKEKKHCILRINAALNAIDEGTYGICSDCGDNIDFKRLRSVPFADHCTECKKEIERNAKWQNSGRRSYQPKKPPLREIVR